MIFGKWLRRFFLPSPKELEPKEVLALLGFECSEANEIALRLTGNNDLDAAIALLLMNKTEDQ